MRALCPQGHDNDLGEVPLDQGDVRWECAGCQAIGVVPGNVQIPDDARFLTDGDSGAADERT